MQNTQERNGVILYVAVNLKQFVIYGDQGINDIVGADFWNSNADDTNELPDEISKG